MCWFVFVSIKTNCRQHLPGKQFLRNHKRPTKNWTALIISTKKGTGVIARDDNLRIISKILDPFGPVIIEILFPLS